MTLTAVTLTACGDDGDGGSSGGGGNTLVGTWQRAYSDGAKDVIVINNNNTGTTTSYSSSGYVTESFSFSYVISGNTLHVYPSSNVDNDFITTFTIVSISNNSFVINNGESNYTYTRVGGSSGGGSSSNTGTFQGAKRVFGNNLVKAFGQEGYDRYEFTYDSKGFVTHIHRTRYETNSSNTEYDLYITYNENVVINTYKDGALQGTSTINIGSNGFASSFTYGNEVNTLSYNSDNQLTSITYSYNNKTEVNSYTYSGGNIIQSAWDGEVESSIAYTSPTQSAIANVAGVMEYDNAMGIDMDDYALAYYCGLAGFGTKNLPLTYTGSHSTAKNTWTLDANGRATKVIVEKTSYGSTSTKTFFWEY